MEHYVTLFDSLFLPQGLALYASMQRHLTNYRLWIICVDSQVYSSLEKLNLPNVKLLQLSQLETPELIAIKPTRTTREYCWTLTPFAPRFVFESDSTVDRVTYLDADIWFRKNPNPIFKEFEASGKHVMITDHAYAPEYDQSAKSGQFCVQFMIFTRKGGEAVRKWWEERCIEWCFARFEDGKFGDQKYLDSWPNLFDNLVHVLSNKEFALAPWNATRFPYGNSIIWHFQSLRIIVQKLVVVEYGSYDLPKCTVTNVYNPYIDDLRDSINIMAGIGVAVITQQKISKLAYIKKRLLSFLRQIWNFHISISNSSKI